MSTSDSTLRSSNKKAKPRIKWDEKKLAKQQKERGVLYGRMKIEQVSYGRIIVLSFTVSN